MESYWELFGYTCNIFKIRDLQEWRDCGGSRTTNQTIIRERGLNLNSGDSKTKSKREREKERIKERGVEGKARSPERREVWASEHPRIIRGDILKSGA
jgi:hypothetical protein